MGVQALSAARAIPGAVLALLALTLAAWCAVVAASRARSAVDRGIGAAILRYQLLMCAALLVAGLDLALDLPARLPAALGWALRVGAAGLSVLAAALFVLALDHYRDRPAEPAGCALVLGMALEYGKPNRDLLYRLDAAAKYARIHPEAQLVLTGGNATAGSEAEAEVMRRLLLTRGVPDARLWVEDRATDTPGNFRNVARLVDPARPVVVITSRYHMFRALGLARSAGFAHAHGLAAPCDPRTLPANAMWEIVCAVDAIRRGKMRL